MNVSSEEWKKKRSEWLERTRDLLAAMPHDYGASSGEAAELTHAFRTTVAAALQPRFNAHITSMPKDSIADKSALASWVNHELHQLGLAIRCPRTGGPAILTADTRTPEDDAGRFRLEVRGVSPRRIRTLTSVQLFELEIMEDVPRQEGGARWQRKTETRSSRPR